MDLFDAYETSSELENNGVVLNFGPSKVTVARNGGSNLEHIKCLTEELKKLGKTGGKSLDFVEEQEVLKKIFCKSVIKNHQIKNEKEEWVDGVMVKEKGKKKILPFTADNMFKMLQQLPEYYNEIKRYADDYKTFSATQLKDQEKN